MLKAEAEGKVELPALVRGEEFAGVVGEVDADRSDRQVVAQAAADAVPGRSIDRERERADHADFIERGSVQLAP